MKLAVVGTGYVGLVTGVTLSEIGHHVTCIDINEAKVEEMRNEISPIYESRLSKLMEDNTFTGRMDFKCNHEEGFNEAIALEMLENDDGSANLIYEAEDVATTIALTAKQDTIVVTKSTVPVGTNDRLLQIIDHNKLYHIIFKFIKEESIICDSFHKSLLVYCGEIVNIVEAADCRLIIRKDKSISLSELDYFCCKYISRSKKFINSHLQLLFSKLVSS